eukprot:TRINITY_DN12713_c0_g1_i1.p1 TRINITY_DN12713_c0_g1~~TRINITY_DN12713_c0_g1_i1.p1  ORF type:complete len:677 (-),score=151.98 TRINITY_DN12713_c0_g1_i1:283-2313(-)
MATGGYAAPGGQPQNLTFKSFLPAPDVAFWQELMRLKLEVLRLDSRPLDVKGYFEAGSAMDKCHLLKNSFEERPQFPAGASVMSGRIQNFNTIEEFKAFLQSDAKTESVSEMLQTVQKDVASGEALRDPKRLRPFLAVVFADLKKYLFSYTVSFPVFAPSSPWRLEESIEPAREIVWQVSRQLLEDNELAAAGAFLIVLSEDLKSCSLRPLAALLDGGNGSELPEGRTMVGFVDPSQEDAPGQPLRNLLAAVAYHRPGLRRYFAFRDLFESRKASEKLRSRILVVESNSNAEALLKGTPGASNRFAGWSKANTVELMKFLDKKQMAADAVDLNVQLMKWRLMPELEPGKLRGLKCLLLGAGTLGCSVSRVLMGWGVRHMTFVDSGKVGLSNPVRQSLFTHADAAGGRSKAVAAKDAILAVMPEATAEAIEMEIPMPGHPNQSEEALAAAVKRLQDLVASHDVVLMLTDSRESRWLPSLLVASAQLESRSDGKPPPLGMYVALGFDSFLVGRQSYRGSDTSACYFCNDLTAPSDSLAFRTLDQQCTVTRPGLSGISASVAVELLAALTQHQDGFAAICNLGDASGGIGGRGPSPLGAVPHQIRGYLADFKLAPAETEPFTKCICCSTTVLKTFQEEGLGFISRIVKRSSDLEELSGLADMKNCVNEDDVLSFDDFDD